LKFGIKKGSENVVTDHLSRLTVDFTKEATPISETFPDEQLMHIAHTPSPWFTFLSIVLIRSLGDVSLSMTKLMSSPFAMIMLVEATLVQRRPLQRFCNVNFIGLPCSVTLIPIVPLVSVARS
jgi:hypothetical protein